MAESDILQYTVDLDESEKPQVAYGGGVPGKRDPMSRALLIAVVVLIVVIAAVAWRWMYRSKPDCGRYKGGDGQTKHHLHLF